MEHAKAYIAVTAPTVNSYKRLKVGDPRSGATWAPVYVSYAYNNRTQMLRVPAPGRVEDRTVDGSCNPYLAATVLLAAGLDGIERELECARPERDEPVRVDAGAAPRARHRHPAGEPARRHARAGARRRDPPRPRQARRDGDYLDYFVACKRREVQAAHEQITQWELDRYLQLF